MVARNRPTVAEWPVRPDCRVGALARKPLASHCFGTHRRAFAGFDRCFPKPFRIAFALTKPSGARACLMQIVAL
jgi:hypothetical protein